LKKNIISLTILALVMMLAVPTMAASDDIKVYVNANQINFPDQKPLINADSRTLVPVRFISEALGAKVDWIALTRTVKIDYEGTTILLVIGLKQATVGTDMVALDTKADIVNDRTMVPLRFVSECLGANVEWNGEKREIYITTADYVSDESLIDSELVLETPPPGDNPYNVNLTVIILYHYGSQIEPQLADLEELLENRFGNEAAPVMEYIRTKDGTNTRLETKDWTIKGKLVRVYDSIGEVSVQVWN